MMTISGWCAWAGLLGICMSAMGQRPAVATSKTVAETLGYPKNSRLLVIEADDLGLAHSIDKATFEALDKGWITAAEVLVPAPWFAEVTRWAKDHPNADLGVLLDLNSDWTSCRWRPVSDHMPESGLVDNDGYLPASWRYVAQHAKMEDVEKETRAQVEQAIRSGISVSHLGDYKKTIMLTPSLFRVYWKLGQEYKLPLFLPNQQVVTRGQATADGHTYKFGGVDVDLRTLPVDRVLEMMPGIATNDWSTAYKRTLDALPVGGVYLLKVNLGFNDDELKGLSWDRADWGSQWRQNDYDVISNPEFQKFLKDKGFVLVGWKDLQKAMPEHP